MAEMSSKKWPKRLSENNTLDLYDVDASGKWERFVKYACFQVFFKRQQ